MTRVPDVISPEQAATLPALFAERVRRTPSACAYRRFEPDGSCCNQVSWQEAMALRITSYNVCYTKLLRNS